MDAQPCSMCGRLRDPSVRCPQCGNTPETLSAEVARLTKAIADMNAEDLRLSGERKKLSSKLQAALYQRDILAHAEAERQKKAAPKQRRWLPRSSAAGKTTAPPAGPPTSRAAGVTVGASAPGAAGSTPAGDSAGATGQSAGRTTRTEGGGTATGGRPTGPDGSAATGGVPRQPRADAGRPRVAPLADAPPSEASPRQVQNVMLALGALMFGVAAAVFGAVALSNVDLIGRLAVLGIATAALLAIAPGLVRKNLSSTAESLATVGLGLLLVDCYLISQLEVFAGASRTLAAGLVFAASAGIAFLYHQATGLTAARYAVVLFVQPVIPLIGFDLVNGPAGWALASTLVAALNAVVARQIERSSRPTPTPIGWSAFWLRELAWVLFGLAIGAGMVYGLAALLTADGVLAATRAGFTLLLAAAVGLVGALMLRKRPLNDVAAGALTLALIGSAARVANVALPGRALVVIAAVVAITGLLVRLLPHDSRRGPQLASTFALATISIFVIGGALRSAFAPVLAARPVWEMDVATFPAQVAERSGSPGWQLAVTVALLSIAAALALPATFRREAAVAGGCLTALAAPASFAMSWAASLWLLVGAAIIVLALGIGLPSNTVTLSTDRLGPGIADRLSGWSAQTRSEELAHLFGAVALAAAGIGVALAQPGSTAGVLSVLTVAGIVLAVAGGGAGQLPTPPVGGSRVIRFQPARTLLSDTAAGLAAFAAPAAVGASVYTVIPKAPAGVALAVAFIATSVTLAVVAFLLVAHRRIGTPLGIGTGLGALVITGAAFGVDGASALDAGVGALLLLGAILLTLAPSVDAGRRADRWLDGADVAAAAVTAGLIGSLARTAALVSPVLWLVLTALLVLLVAVGVRALPEEIRRGPIVGAGIAGGILGIVAGYPALAGGVQALAAPGELWDADLPSVADQTAFGWQAPAALVVLALAAAIALPRPRNHDAAAAAMVLATVGTPAALGLPWWAPVVLGLLIATGYAMASVVAVDPRGGYARMAVAVAVALHALGAALVRPWTTAAALAVIALISLVVVGLTVFITRRSTTDDGVAPAHLDVVGGAGVLGVLLAGPAALATIAAALNRPLSIVLISALCGVVAGLLLLAAARRQVAPYLGWGTVGIAISSTLIALTALLAGRPAGVYAAAATLLVVLAEVMRTNTLAQLGIERAPRRRQPEPAGPRRWQVGLGDTTLGQEMRRRWPSYPGAMAAVACLAPALIAITALAPALHDALITPYESLSAIWEGPPAPRDTPLDVAAVLAALLLTISAAIAAIGFGGGLNRAVSVIVPGVAITLLITPIGLGMSWPAAVLGCLTVYTLCVLSVALTDPPTNDDTERSLRAARVIVLIIGLIAGGSGLAGALATPGMTVFTLGGSAVVGMTAAIGGRSQAARIQGWLGGALSAQLFVLTVSLWIGAQPTWAAFGVLAVGAALIFSTTLLPRFARPDYLPEASAVEWAGYIAAVIALALAARSPAFVAALLVGWGAVLWISASRPGRTGIQRRILFWAAAGCEIGAWWLIMRDADIAVPEAYTIPFALLALLVGQLELRQRPTLGSWAAYGPALVAGFGPTVIVVLMTEANPIREVGLLLAALLTLIYGSLREQQAPVAVGAVVLTITALHALTVVVDSILLAILIGGVILIILGASSERRRRATERYQQYR
jgi:hypothetical protein